LEQGNVSDPALDMIRIILSHQSRSTSFSNQDSGLRREKNTGQSIWTSPSEEVVFAYLSIRAIQPRQKPDEETNQGPWSRNK